MTDGDEASFDAVIVATDASESARLTGTEDPGWNGVTSIWLSSPVAPIEEPILALNGTGLGAINSLAPMSHVSSDYAPSGHHLIVVSAPTIDQGAPAAMRKQLVDWFGPVADTYAELRVDRIEKAQPKTTPRPRRPSRRRGKRNVPCRRSPSRRIAQRCDRLRTGSSPSGDPFDLADLAALPTEEPVPPFGEREVLVTGHDHHVEAGDEQLLGDVFG